MVPNTRTVIFSLQVSLARNELKQGPRIDIQNEGAKIVLYLASPGGASIVDAGEEDFLFWFPGIKKMRS